MRSERRKLEKEEEKLLNEIEDCENKIKENENMLAQPEIYSDGEKSKAVQLKINGLKKISSKLSEKWAEIASLLEN